EELIPGTIFTEGFDDISAPPLSGYTTEEIEHALTMVQVTIGIVDAVRTSHTQPKPILHRDIKPENILITPNGEVKLIDPGCAVSLSGSKITPPMISHGDAAYLPP